MAWTGPVATLASRDRSGEINAVIETPKGSRNKFKYDPASDLFRLSHVLPAGASFPFSFGFIPKTLGADGDPLDVIVLLDEPVPVGCLVAVRLIGVMEAEQSSGSRRESNDRLLAVAVECSEHRDVSGLKDVNRRLLDELAHFFTSYNALRGRTFRVSRWRGPRHAQKAMKTGARKFQRDSKR